MSRAATHGGNCQVCGHFQKLPGGKLARHGFTVEHGWQEGTCWGSEELPLQLSCELIAKSIEGARKEHAAIIARATELRKPATEPKGWASKTSYKGRSRITFPVEVDILLDKEGRPYYVEDDMYGRKFARTAIQLSYKIKTALDMANYLNEQEATRIERKLPMIEDYIKHQTEVVRTWKPAPLTPLKRAA